jgi:hypothetical protein
MSYNPYVQWCDEDTGTDWVPYNIVRAVMHALYYACKLTAKTLIFLGKTILLFLPSGAKIPILDNYEVPDWRDEWPEKTFNRWSLTIGGIPVFKERWLPLNGIREWWKIFIGPIDYSIGTGEYIYFKDHETGLWKPGKDFTPPKTYTLFGNLLLDAGSAAVIVGVARALQSTGLPKTALAFLSSLFNGYTSVKRMLWMNEQDTDVDRIDAEVDKLLERIDVSSVDDRFDKIDSNLGVRIKIG